MPLQLFIPRRVKYWKPVAYAEIPGRFLDAQHDYVGRRIAVTMPEDPATFDASEHIQDLGPLRPGEGTAPDPYLIIPGFGEMGLDEIQDVIAHVRERNAERVEERSASRLGNDADRFNRRFKDHLDQTLRARKGMRTFGPGTQPTR